MELYVLPIVHQKVKCEPQRSLILRIITHKQQMRAGNGASTLALKPVGRDDRSPKQRVQAVPQNGDWSPQKSM